MRFNQRILAGLLLGAVVALPQALFAAPAQTTAWKLRVALDGAAVRLEPDLRSPVMTTVAKGTTLNSYEAVGAWFRVVVPPGKDEITIIGFIASNEVEILEEKTTPKPDFWAPEAGTFQGLGFDVQVGVGYTYFGSGDLDAGVRGMYDDLRASLQAKGYPIMDEKIGPFRSGVHVTADIIYNLNPRLGAGIGVEYIYARRFDGFGYMMGIIYNSANSVPILQILILRPEIAYTIPLGKFLAVKLSGGPALFLTTFEYNRNAAIAGWEESFFQRGRKSVLGAQAGAGLEIRINPRTAFVLQAMGRYGKTSNMTGDEEDIVLLSGWDVSGPEIKGPLFFLPGGPFPRLAVRSEAPGGDARKARVDFTGVDFTFGLRVKF